MNGAQGSLRVILTVLVSTASTLSSTFAKSERKVAPTDSSRIRSRENLTSSAVMSLPSWNLAFCLILKVYVLSSSPISYESAISVPIFPSAW